MCAYCLIIYYGLVQKMHAVHVLVHVHAVHVLVVCWVHKSAVQKYCWLQIYDLHYVVVYAVCWRMPMSCKTRSALTQSHLSLDLTVPCATRQCVLHK